MPEADIVQHTSIPNTRSSLRHEFEALGVQRGATIILHSALSKLGWTVGGPVAVIQALLDLLGSEGTLVMPTQTGDNSDPAAWENPPVPAHWWQKIRDEMPAYHPDITPTRQMGVVAETFRRWPGVVRSRHPSLSFAAWGRHAAYMTEHHPVGDDLGEKSALGRVYALDGQILLLGVKHDNNTSLHLAEHRASFRGKGWVRQSAAMLVDGQRQWVTWEALDYDADDFGELGDAYEAATGYQPGRVGLAETRLIRQRDIVDFGVRWLATNRNLTPNE